jgi:hypothetical protein
VHVPNISTGHDQVVYRATSGGANFASITEPAYDADANAFVWARKNLGSGTGNRIVRYELTGSRLGYAPGSPRYNSISWAGPQLGAATSSSLDGGDSPGACDDAGIHYCYVTVTGPLSFARNP